jgi:acyclic terpene utilization AtuA family protein
MKDKIIIANASGFWGDEADAIRRQVQSGHIDYLTMDYLAEITMIILGRQVAKKPDAGYARDFVTTISGVLKDIQDKGITVITNAGGINPQACARALEQIMSDQGLSIPIATIDGDNLMPELPQLVEEGCLFTHIDTGESLGSIADTVAAANAYIGARPIVEALKGGAKIVITGRCYDAASVVAPFIYEFGWDWEEYDKLASALLAGHLIECGTQSTGGNFTNWKQVGSFLNMGYPLVEASPDGSFVLTKHPGTGGLVSEQTAKEQILYEIGDPRAYISPDVIADFTSFSLTGEGENRVRVSGVRGQKPTDMLKVSINYEAGYKLSGMIVVSGPDVVAKGEVFSEMFWDRVGTDGFVDYRTDYVGYNACWGNSAAPDVEPNEIILRFSARAETKERLAVLSKELAGLILAGPPGVTVFGGRPSIAPAFGYWPALIDRKRVTARLIQGGNETFISCDVGPCGEPELKPYDSVVGDQNKGARVTVPLARIAHARSGDKGDLANIGVAALKPELYPEILREVTTEKLQLFFKSNVIGPIARYRLDNLNAVNFVLQGALNGGGTVSLLLDNQGKTLSQALLTMGIEVNPDLLS